MTEFGSKPYNQNNNNERRTISDEPSSLINTIHSISYCIVKSFEFLLLHMNTGVVEELSKT